MFRFEIILILFTYFMIGTCQLEYTLNDISETGFPETSTNHVFELTQSTNLARLEHVQMTCDNYHSNYTVNDLTSDKLKHILVDHSHKLLYCYVPKVACTNWKRIFLILSGKWNNTNVLSVPATLAHSPGQFTTLENLSVEERDNVLENYTKLIFVRHPFERVLSAYRNKLEDDSPSSHYFQQRVGRMIISKYRPNASNSSSLLGNDVTFKEFIEFISSPATSSESIPYALNEHWKSMDKLCHPCAIKYSIIGKYETLLDDSILALHSVNASHIPFPRDTRTSGTAAKMKKYYVPLPLELITKLYQMYVNDFKLFNYDLEEILGFDLG